MEPIITKVSDTEFSVTTSTTETISLDVLVAQSNSLAANILGAQEAITMMNAEKAAIDARIQAARAAGCITTAEIVLVPDVPYTPMPIDTVPVEVVP